MTMTETPTATKVAGFADAGLIRAACACASTDRSRAPALLCVAFTLHHDRFEVQATDSHVAFWSGETPADGGHLLVDGRDLAAALRTAKAKGLVALTFEHGICTVSTGDITTSLASLATVDAAFPRLAGLIPTGTQELATIGLGIATTAKVIAAAKAVGVDTYSATFNGPLKPIAVRFSGRDDARMLVMPVRLA